MAVLENGRSTAELRALDAADGYVRPPGDDEVYCYLGWQLRAVPVLLIVAYALAAWSLVKFTLADVKLLWPMFVVLGLNAVGTVLSTLTSFNNRRISAKSHRKLVASWSPVGPAPSVDVFLPTLGEDLAVLANTYTYVSRMAWRGPLSVYVLDDGDRAEVAELAAQFGFDYLVRPNRGYMKKAGNLQYAFTQTSGDHIVILDADFCPRADFLAHLMPYMDDATVGIVQSPQFFDTTEKHNWIQRTAGATQEQFYRWILPSRDRFDAAVCVGTCALYRREALQAAGGFAQIEHSEDIHTGLCLMRAGYRTRYVPAVVSRGLCPSDMAGFLNQQYRWCNGSLIRLDNAYLAGRGIRMTLRQRLCFWAGLMYYVTTAVNVVVLYVPGLIMSTFFPAQVQPTQFVPFLLGLWVYLVLLPWVSKGRWRFEVLRLQMAYSFAHLLAIAHRLRGHTAGWTPTGAVHGANALARKISAVGAVAIVLMLPPFWAAVIYDIDRFGPRRFWLMAMFVCLYSYLALPLFVEFLKVLTSRRSAGAAPPAVGGSEPELVFVSPA